MTISFREACEMTIVASGWDKEIKMVAVIEVGSYDLYVIVKSKGKETLLVCMDLIDGSKNK